MRQLVAISLFVCMLLGSGLVFGQGQQPATISLGEVARQLQAERQKEGKKPKVYTNENLPPPRWEPGFQIAARKPGPPGMAAGPRGMGMASGGHDETYFRTRMNELRAKLAQDEADLSTLQQKIGQADVQFYTDPNKGLQQQYSRGDITKLAQDIQKKQQAIADDQKAMDDLRDELRREGGEAGWLR